MTAALVDRLLYWADRKQSYPADDSGMRRMRRDVSDMQELMRVAANHIRHLQMTKKSPVVETPGPTSTVAPASTTTKGQKGNVGGIGTTKVP